MTAPNEIHLAHCPRCGKLFSSREQAVCRSCESAEEEDFRRIRDVLRTGNAGDVESLASEADVSVNTVLRMLDQGRIAAATDMDVRCGRCGAPAIGPQQRLCTKCALELDRNLAQALNEARALAPTRMATRANRVHQHVIKKRRHA